MHFSLKYQFNIFFYFLSPSSPFSPMIHYHASRRGNKPSDGRIFERYGRWIFHVSRDDLLSRGNRLLIHRVSRCGSKGTDRLFEGFAIPFDSQKLDPLSRGPGGWPWMTLIPLIPFSLSSSSSSSSTELDHILRRHGLSRLGLLALGSEY